MLTINDISKFVLIANDFPWLFQEGQGPTLTGRIVYIHRMNGLNWIHAERERVQAQGCHAALGEPNTRLLQSTRYYHDLP